MDGQHNTQGSSPFGQTIQTFLDAASSPSPTPGGGSVAALVAALGASMTSMVANLTQGQKFTEVAPKMAALVADMQASMARFESLLQADVQSFNQYMAALKLPKATEDEKQARRDAIQAATVAATEVPIALAQDCLRALEATGTAAAEANPQVLSDLGIAAMLLDTAGQSALLTADINIPSIKDDERRSQFQTVRNELGNRLDESRTETVRIVRQRMANG